MSIFTFLPKKSFVFFQSKPLISALPGVFFVFFVLHFFSPFGNSKIEPESYRITVNLMFSTIPIQVHILLYYFFDRFGFKIFNKKIILFEVCVYILGLFISGSLAYIYNCLFFTIIFPENFHVYYVSFFNMIKYAFIIGFPVVFMIKLFDIIYLYKEKTFNNTHSSKKSLVILSSDKKNEEIFKMESKSIVYFESNKNNLTVYFFDQNGNVKNIVLKKALKEIERDYCNNDYMFFRCHKSFIINLNLVEQISGNSRYGTVVLKGGHTIPVSRNKLNELKDIIIDDFKLLNTKLV